MMTFLCILLAAVFLAADVLLAREFYKIAVIKGWSEKKYFWLPIFLTLGGYMLIIALPDRSGAGISALVSDDLPEL